MKSVVFRIFAPEWKFHTYITVTNIHPERDLIEQRTQQFRGMKTDLLKPTSLHSFHDIKTLDVCC